MAGQKLSARTEITAGLTGNDFVHLVNGGASWKVKLATLKAFLTPGSTWTLRASAADNYWFSVTFGNGLFVAVAGSGVGNRVMTSPDGIAWTLRASAADNYWTSIAFGNGLFVAVAITGAGNRVMTSP